MPGLSVAITELAWTESSGKARRSATRNPTSETMTPSTPDSRASRSITGRRNSCCSGV
jgi:hypothetical protein